MSNIHIHKKATVAYFFKGEMDRNDVKLPKNQTIQKRLNMPPAGKCNDLIFQIS